MTRALRVVHGLFPLQAHDIFVLPVYCRARSKVSHASGAAGSVVSSGDGSGGGGSSLPSLQSERASNMAGIVWKEPGTQGVAGQDVNDLRHEKQQESSGNFDHVSKGSMLLKRMGWTEGKGLGRRSDGKLQPVQVRKRCIYGRVSACAQPVGGCLFTLVGQALSIIETRLDLEDGFVVSRQWLECRDSKLSLLTFWTKRLPTPRRDRPFGLAGRVGLSSMGPICPYRCTLSAIS